jgi:EAL domain-containing protein (putative c-di-GMP-specific phosphodiesterase class I)
MNKKIMKLAVVVPALIATFVVICVLAFNAVRHFIIEENEVLVHSVAQSILPALLVNDTQQVEALMKALESYPGIESAELLSSEGASIASYARAGQLDPISTSFELASAVDAPHQAHVMAPITFDSLIVANLYIAVNLWPTYLRILTWLGVLLIVPSAIYVCIKQLRIKVRFEKVVEDGGGDDPGHSSFDVAHAMSVAMSDADISLEYQPIQRMSDGGLFGMEVVVCWRHPAGQTLHVSPSAFVDLAAKNGICLPFDGWLINTALTNAATWQHQYGPLILTINITAEQFQDPTFGQRIRWWCEQTQYPHQLLELEVNESAIFRHLQQAAAHVASFAEQGLSVTVDGFGLMPSSLELLNVVPVSKVKLDSKLVKRMGQDEQIDQLIQATIERALQNDVQVMADGLEVFMQRVALRQMGCILGQGAYFYPPLTASAFDACLAARPFDAAMGGVSQVNAMAKEGHGFSVA